MSLLLALALASTAHTTPNCSWDRPGANPFTGDPVAAVDHYPDIPADVRAALKERIAARKSDEIVTIHRDSIVGNREYDPAIRGMHFGASQVCNTVSRSKWAPRKVERALVYCEQNECIIVPAICGNVSRVTRLPEKVAVAAAPPVAPTPVIPVTPQQMASLVHKGPDVVADEDPTPKAVASRILYAPPTVLAPTPVVIASDIPVRAVPEAGTWAMLLAGLGFVGFAARRRSR